MIIDSCHLITFLPRLRQSDKAAHAGRSHQRELEKARQSPGVGNSDVHLTQQCPPVTVRLLSNGLDTVLLTRRYRKPSGERTLVESVFSHLIPTPSGQRLIVQQGEASPKPSPGSLTLPQRELDQTLREPQPLRCRDYLHLCSESGDV